MSHGQRWRQWPQWIEWSTCTSNKSRRHYQRINSISLSFLYLASPSYIRHPIRLCNSGVLVTPRDMPVMFLSLVDRSRCTSHFSRIYISQNHMGRCGGDRRRHACGAWCCKVKRLALRNTAPRGQVIPLKQLSFEPLHLINEDKSKHGHLYAIGGGLHLKDTLMDVLISSFDKVAINPLDNKR